MDPFCWKGIFDAAIDGCPFAFATAGSAALSTNPSLSDAGRTSVDQLSLTKETVSSHKNI
jgi:hypothetical protein